MDSPELEFPWGREFPYQSRPVLGPTQPTVQSISCLFPGVQRQNRGIVHPLPSSVEVKEWVELYYTLSRPTCLVIGRNLFYRWSFSFFWLFAEWKWCHLWVLYSANIRVLKNEEKNSHERTSQWNALRTSVRYLQHCHAHTRAVTALDIAQF